MPTFGSEPPATTSDASSHSTHIWLLFPFMAAVPLAMAVQRRKEKSRRLLASVNTTTKYSPVHSSPDMELVDLPPQASAV